MVNLTPDGPVLEVTQHHETTLARSLSASEKAALDAPRYSQQEVLAIASLLVKARNFPIDVLTDVLQFAGVGLTFEIETNDVCPGRDDMSTIYLQLDIPNCDALMLPHGVRMLPACRGLTVECASRDQGWASFDTEHNGTYSHSFTWSEVAIIKDSGVDGPLRAASTMISPNVRVSRRFQHHLKRFEDPEGFIANLSPGDAIQLILRSQYPGWKNTANYGRVRAWFFVEIDEDAQLYTWDQLERMDQEQRGESQVDGIYNKCTLQ